MKITKTSEELKQLYSGLSNSAQQNKDIDHKLFSIGVWFVFDRHSDHDNKMYMNDLISGLFTTEGSDKLTSYIEANSDLANNMDTDETDLIYNAILSFQFIETEAFYCDKYEVQMGMMDLALGMINAYGYLIQSEDYHKLLNVAAENLNGFRAHIIASNTPTEGRSDN